MKKFKTKTKQIKKRIIWFLIIIFSIFIFIFISLQKLKSDNSHLINILLEQNGIISSSKSIVSYLTKNIDYLINDYSFIEKKSVLYLNNSITQPIIYIYNTHDQEEYKNTTKTYQLIPNVYTANNLLKEQLKEYNISSIVEENKVSKYLDRFNYSYGDSYKVSRMFLENSILKYPSLEYFIDIHRDSVSKKYTTITINNKKYAKIMFVLGLDNPSYLETKKIMTKLNDYINEEYPNVSRGIYEKSKEMGDGIYNQDFNKNTLLIEVGGIDNTIMEVNNSTEIIAKALYYVIGDGNEKIS